MEKPILAVGDINADLLWSLPSFPFEGDDCTANTLTWSGGGGALNGATAMARLGGQVCLWGRVGGDPGAQVPLAAAREAGVDLHLLEEDPKVPTGTCSVAVSPGGHRTFFSFRGANVRLGVDGPSEAVSRLLAGGAALVYVNGHGLLEEPGGGAVLAAVHSAIKCGVPICLDLSLPVIRRKWDVVNGLIPQIQLLAMNETEAQEGFPGLTPEQVVRLVLEKGAQAVAVKLGPKGCVAGWRQPLRVGQPQPQSLVVVHERPPTVCAVDTTACGDAFSGALAWALMKGLPPIKAIKLANTMGALTATKEGAALSIPSITGDVLDG